MYEPPINPVGNSLRHRLASALSNPSQTVDASSMSLFDSLLEVTSVPAAVLPPQQNVEPQAPQATEPADVEATETAEQPAEEEAVEATDLAFLAQQSLVAQQPIAANPAIDVNSQTSVSLEQISDADTNSIPLTDVTATADNSLVNAAEDLQTEQTPQISAEVATPVLTSGENPEETAAEVSALLTTKEALIPANNGKDSAVPTDPALAAKNTEEEVVPQTVAGTETPISSEGAGEEESTSRRGSSRNREKAKAGRVANENDIDQRQVRQIDREVAPVKSPDPATIKVEETLLASQETPHELLVSTTSTPVSNQPTATPNSANGIRPEIALPAASLNGSNNSAAANKGTGIKGSADNSVDGIIGRSPSTNSPAGKSVSGKEEAATADPQEAVDRAKLVRRVTRAFQKLGDVGGTVRVRLSPPNLGTVKIEIQVEGSHMKAKLTAESEGVRAIINDQLGDLRARLAEQGIQVDKIEVDTEASNSGNSMNYRDQSDSQQGETFSQSRRFDRPPSKLPATENRPQILGATSLGWRGDGISVDIHA